MSFEYLKEEHPFVTCEITASEDGSQFIGVLAYRGFENGELSGPSLASVRVQFQMLCELLDQHGGMLRRGTIMLGYHNDELKGDVLLPDGEVIGFWEMDEEDDTSHFTPGAQGDRTLSVPSAWMLQDPIADWLEVYYNN
jgi:hypothetical protein